MLRSADGGADIGDGLQDHARDVQVGALALVGVPDYVVDSYFFKAGDVAEGYGAAEEREGGAASGGAKRAVLVVGG